jgi:hypothetical protein
MTGEFYHKNIFGDVVDIEPSLEEVDEEERILYDKKGKEFNIFALTDAIVSRKKKDSWVIYQKALAAGLVAEEIFWKVVWAVKTLMLAKNTKSAKDADMKDYPYMKAKSALKNWKDGELEKLSESLVIGYHNARRGEGEIDTLIEKTLLKL